MIITQTVVSIKTMCKCANTHTHTDWIVIVMQFLYSSGPSELFVLL